MNKKETQPAKTGRKHFNRRSFKYGSMATAMTALFLVVLIIVNVICTLLVERFPLKLDLTGEKAFELTEQSRNILDSVDIPVTITLLADETDFVAIDDYTAQANEMLKNYARLNSNVTVNYEDPIADPNVLNKYNDLSASTSDIIVSSEKRSVKISSNDLFNFSQNSSGYYIASSNVERCVTSALLSVTSENPPIAAFLEGHEEKALSGLENLLRLNNFEVVSNNIASEGLNTDASILVISAPSRDYTLEELSALDSFLYNGGEYGKVVLYFADSTTAGSLPNLEVFLNDWGIATGEGTVYETDSANVIGQNAYFTRLQYGDEDYSGDLPDTEGLFPVINSAVPLTALELGGGVSLRSKTLLNFYDTSAVRPVTATDSWDPTSEETGTRPAAIMGMTTAIKDNAYSIHSYVVAFGSYSFADASYLENPSYSNSEYLLHLCNQLLNKDDSLTIYAKSLSSSYLDVTAQQSNLIWILFAFVLPAMILVYGVYVFIRRRHL